MAPTDHRRFGGFNRDALDLPRQPDANNTSTWCAAHRQDFRELLEEPAFDLVVELGPCCVSGCPPGSRASRASADRSWWRTCRAGRQALLRGRVGVRLRRDQCRHRVQPPGSRPAFPSGAISRPACLASETFRVCPEPKSGPAPMYRRKGRG